MTLRNLLLRAYPRSWRYEYGEELAGVLAQKRLTFPLVADVLGNGARQHLLRDEPWKICAAGLALWNLTVLLLVFGRFFTSRPALAWCYMAGFLFLFGAGAWTVVRKNSAIWRATAVSAMAALVGHSPDIVLFLGMLRNGGGRWILRTSEFNLVFSLVFGFAGAALARVFVSLRKQPREA
jgi:hypothetical protein